MHGGGVSPLSFGNLNNNRTKFASALDVALRGSPSPLPFFLCHKENKNLWFFSTCALSFWGSWPWISDFHLVSHDITEPKHSSICTQARLSELVWLYPGRDQPVPALHRASWQRAPCRSPSGGEWDAVKGDTDQYTSTTAMSDLDLNTWKGAALTVRNLPIITDHIPCQLAEVWAQICGHNRQLQRITGWALWTLTRTRIISYFSAFIFPLFFFLHVFYYLTLLYIFLYATSNSVFAIRQVINR